VPVQREPPVPEELIETAETQRHVQDGTV
jgi:hypothetical protein